MFKLNRRMTHLKVRLKALKEENLDTQEIKFLASAGGFDIFFADDSRQSNPYRKGMGPIIGIGGLNVCITEFRLLLSDIEVICNKVGFPANEEFKWSPGRELWMHDHLVGQERQAFFLDVIEQLRKHEVIVFIIIKDTSYRSATGASSSEEDITTMFLERVQHQCNKNSSCGMVIVDRPSGSRSAEDKFLMSCLETIQQGTTYVNMDNIAHNVVSTPSKLSRLLQAADLISGAAVSYVAGESVYSPPIFSAIIPLLYNDGNRIGGYGFKIHPSYRYLNLYHWLVGDSHFWRMNVGVPLPREGHLYAKNPYE